MEKRRFREPALTALMQYFGGEVALAYNVLNTTNYWAIALVGGLVTALLADGKYPNVSRLIVVAIGIAFMTRFFVRSCLGLMNMYRWNLLNQIILDILGGRGDLERNHQRLDDALELYYYRFYSPITRSKILWESMKLAYLWLFAALVFLFVWGFIWLWPAPTPVLIGAGLLAVLIVEACFFMKSPMFRHIPLPGGTNRLPHPVDLTLEDRLRRLEACCQKLEDTPSDGPKQGDGS